MRVVLRALERVKSITSIKEMSFFSISVELESDKVCLCRFYSGADFRLQNFLNNFEIWYTCRWVNTLVFFYLFFLILGNFLLLGDECHNPEYFL